MTANVTACNYCAWAIPKEDAEKGLNDTNASYVSRHCGRSKLPENECEYKEYNGTTYQVCYCNDKDACTTPKLIRSSGDKIALSIGIVVVLMTLNMLKKGVV